MNPKETNPLHMPHLQAIEMLIKAGYSGDINDIRNQLIRESISDPAKIKNLIAQWNALRYPNDCISYLLASVYELCPQIHKTHPEAQAILLLMLRIQAQNSGCVAVVKGDFAKAMNWGSKKAGRISERLDELEETGAIIPIYKAPEGSTKPSIYRINPALSKIGQGFHAEQIKPSQDPEIYSRSAKTIQVLTDKEKKDYYCGILVKIVDTRKKKEPVPTKTLTQSEPHTGSEPQDHLTRPEKKNQDIYTDNMQNAENLLTPEENEMFSGTL